MSIKIDRAKSHELMKETEIVLRPIIEKYKECCSSSLLEDYENGFVAGIDVIRIMFENLNPYPKRRRAFELNSESARSIMDNAPNF